MVLITTIHGGSLTRSVPLSKGSTGGCATYGEACLSIHIFECSAPHLLYMKEHMRA